jgi:hypothetical protein
MDVYCERMERKGVGQERIEICLGSGHDPKWPIQPLVTVVA